MHNNAHIYFNSYFPSFHEWSCTVSRKKLKYGSIIIYSRHQPTKNMKQTLFVRHVFCATLFCVEVLKGTSLFIVRCLLNIEKRKDTTESSTWALSNFLKEVNQSKDNAPASKNCPGECYVISPCMSKAYPRAGFFLVFC